MHGKPKLFFTDVSDKSTLVSTDGSFIFCSQICQGPGTDSGALSSSKGGLPPQNNLYIRLPTNSDLLFAHANMCGLMAFDNPQAGSWFFSALHEVLQKQATELDLLSMLTIVQYKVALREVYPVKTKDGQESLETSANSPGTLKEKIEESKHKTFYKQMPNFFSTLRKIVKLNK